MAKKKTNKTAVELASELLECRRAISEWKTIEKPLADELKKRIKKGEKQDSFRITVSSAFKVENIETALAWANKYAPSTITIDAAAARKVFLGDVATGAMGSAEKNGFTFEETEKLVSISGDDLLA